MISSKPCVTVPTHLVNFFRTTTLTAKLSIKPIDYLIDTINHRLSSEPLMLCAI